MKEVMKNYEINTSETQREQEPGTSGANNKLILQSWLKNIRDRLFFLSKNEHSTSSSLVNFVELLKEKAFLLETSENDTVEFLLTLDDLFSKEQASLSLHTQFFLKNLLKKYRPLIEKYRKISTESISFPETIDRSKMTDPMQQLHLKMQALKKKKSEFQESESKLSKTISDLKEFTKEEDVNFDKLINESNRGFTKEIEGYEEKLLSDTLKFEEISKKINGEVNGDLELTKQQLEAKINNINTKISKFTPVFYGLKFLIRKAKNISWGEAISHAQVFNFIIEVNQKQMDLEKVRQALFVEVKEYDLEKLYKNEIEKSEEKSEEKSAEKIRRDLKHNKNRLERNSAHLEKIVEHLNAIKNRLEITPEGEKIISEILEIINSSISLSINKRALEEKQYDITDLSEKNKNQNSKEQIEINHSKLNLLSEKYAKNQEKLISSLNDSLLRECLEKFVHEIESNICELENKKRNFELRLEKLEISVNSNKYNEKIHETKAAKTIFELIQNSGIVKSLSYFINANKKAATATTPNQIKVLKALIVKYREEIINRINNVIVSFSSELHQIKEVELKRNDEQEKDLAKEIHLQAVTEGKDQFCQAIVNELTNTYEQQEKNCFSELINTVTQLKERIDNTEWNKSGWGFFKKKVPDGIQKIRSLLNESSFLNQRSLDHLDSKNDESNLVKVSLLSKIYHLIKQKNSSEKFLRSHKVKEFYLEIDESLLQLKNKLKSELEPEWFKLLWKNPNINNNQAFILPDKSLFKAITSESEDANQPTCSVSLSQSGGH